MRVFPVSDDFPAPCIEEGGEDEVPASAVPVCIARDGVVVCRRVFGSPGNRGGGACRTGSSRTRLFETGELGSAIAGKSILASGGCVLRLPDRFRRCGPSGDGHRGAGTSSPRRTDLRRTHDDVPGEVQHLRTPLPAGGVEPGAARPLRFAAGFLPDGAGAGRCPPGVPSLPGTPEPRPSVSSDGPQSGGDGGAGSAEA